MAVLFEVLREDDSELILSVRDPVSREGATMRIPLANARTLTSVMSRATGHHFLISPSNVEMQHGSIEVIRNFSSVTLPKFKVAKK